MLDHCVVWVSLCVNMCVLYLGIFCMTKLSPHILVLEECPGMLTEKSGGETERERGCMHGR